MSAVQNDLTTFGVERKKNPKRGRNARRTYRYLIIISSVVL